MMSLYTLLMPLFETSSALGWHIAPPNRRQSYCCYPTRYSRRSSTSSTTFVMPYAFVWQTGPSLWLVSRKSPDACVREPDWRARRLLQVADGRATTFTRKGSWLKAGLINMPWEYPEEWFASTYRMLRTSTAMEMLR
ncbi:hypothetical protein BC835DRAFT_1365162 [Cytidiella melzeri]|nr:hypothetical protein BC835DRAFT_1365162 [Cytidiella melzeri]